MIVRNDVMVNNYYHFAKYDIPTTVIRWDHGMLWRFQNRSRRDSSQIPQFNAVITVTIFEDL